MVWSIYPPNLKLYGHNTLDRRHIGRECLSPPHNGQLPNHIPRGRTVCVSARHMKQIILRWLLKGTWHICDHSFKVKSVSLDGKDKELACEKCGVYAMNYLPPAFQGMYIIPVDSTRNHPFSWAHKKHKHIKGIFLSK